MGPSPCYMSMLDPVFFRGHPNGRFFVFVFHMDDSADGPRKKIFVVGGLVADSSDWFEIERRWESRVHKVGLNYFHTTESYSLRGEFNKLRETYGKEKAAKIAKDLRTDLKSIVKASTFQTFALGVVLPDYYQVAREVKGSQVFESDPYLAAHWQLIHLVAMVYCDSSHGLPVAFIYDENNKAKYLQYHWTDFKAEHPVAAQCMTTLAPMDDKTTPALQVADLFAHTTKRFFENRLDAKLPPLPCSKPEWGNLAEWNVCRLMFWDKKFLRKIASATLKSRKSGKIGRESPEWYRASPSPE